MKALHTYDKSTVKTVVKIDNFLLSHFYFDNLTIQNK